MTIKGNNKMMSADDKSVKTKAKKASVLRVFVFAGGHKIEAKSYEEALENYQKTLKTK